MGRAGRPNLSCCRLSAERVPAAEHLHVDCVIRGPEFFDPYAGLMLGSIDEVVFDCREPGELAAFWAEVLGGDPVRRSDSWWYVDPPGWTRVAFQRVPEEKQAKNRLHLDVQVADIETATETAEELGAVRVGEIHSDSAGSFQVLLDPEGNEWCLVRPPGDS